MALATNIENYTEAYSFTILTAKKILYNRIYLNYNRIKSPRDPTPVKW